MSIDRQRVKAVEALVAAGYRWADGEWQAPQGLHIPSNKEIRMRELLYEVHQLMQAHIINGHSLPLSMCVLLATQLGDVLAS